MNVGECVDFTGFMGCLVGCLGQAHPTPTTLSLYTAFSFPTPKKFDKIFTKSLQK